MDSYIWMRLATLRCTAEHHFKAGCCYDEKTNGFCSIKPFATLWASLGQWQKTLDSCVVNSIKSAVRSLVISPTPSCESDCYSLAMRIESDTPWMLQLIKRFFWLLRSAEKVSTLPHTGRVPRLLVVVIKNGCLISTRELFDPVPAHIDLPHGVENTVNSKYKEKRSILKSI